MSSRQVIEPNPIKIGFFTLLFNRLKLKTDSAMMTEEKRKEEEQKIKKNKTNVEMK